MARPRHLDRGAERFVRVAAPDDPYLPPAEPPVRRDQPDRRRPKPTGSDGLVATAFGRIRPDELRALRRRGKLDADGALAIALQPTQPVKAVRQAAGAHVKAVVALTLEEYLEHQDRRRQVESEAAQHRGRARRALVGGVPRTPTQRPPLLAGVVRSKGEVPSREVLPEPGDTAAELDTLSGDTSYVDRYDQLAATVPQPAAAEEERAWEVAHGLVPGTLAAERDQERRSAQVAEREHRDALEARRDVRALVAQWRQELADRRSERRCGNPAGCSNEVQGGAGSRCRACYQYRRRHGAERPLSLINRELRRRGLLS